MSYLISVLLHIFLMGDSLAYGTSYFFHADDYSRHSGKGITYNWNKELENKSGDVIVIIIGTNDSYTYTKQHELFITKTKDLMLLAKSKFKRVIWIGPPCVLSKTLDNNLVKITVDQQQLAKDTGIEYYSMREITLINNICVRTNRNTDGVHFTLNGYKLITDWINRKILSLP